MTTTTSNNQMDAILARLEALEIENKSLKESKGKGIGFKNQMKLNKSNGIYFTCPSMKAFSAKTNKEFQTGINIPAYQAPALVNAIKSGEFQKLIEAFAKNNFNGVEY